MSSPPIFNNHSPAPALPQPTFSTYSLLTSPPNPSSQTISESIPQSPHNSSTVPTILTIPTRLSPVATKRLQSITYIAKPPSFNNLHRSCIPPLLPPPPKSDKIAWKRINNPPPPILHLLTFLSVNYQLILDQSLIHLPLPTITHLTTHPPFL